MSLRQLRAIGFLELSEESDGNYNDYQAVRPTSAGTTWAREHPTQMSPAGSESPSDEDIPF
jgi:hypothetical protein